MAETVHLILKAAGSPIEGESTQTSLKREKTIECVQYKHSVKTQREGGSAHATGRRQYEELEIVKRIDRSTPLLMKALTENTELEATFMFYRPNPAGDGTTEQFYTVVLKKARISAIEQYSPDVFEPAKTPIPPFEKVRFVFGHINWTYTNGGVQHEDDWAASK